MANVNNGGHWVLVTGVGDGYATVNDPGYDRGTYRFNEISQYGWY